MSQKLGLGPNPEKVEYLFVGEQEGEQGNSLWYKLSDGKVVPVLEEALTGQLTDIVVITKEFKGKTNYKVNFHIQADRKYVIRSGAGTTFSRGVVLGLLEVLKIDPSFNPITIAVSQSQEDSKAVFGSVYDARGMKAKPKWDGQASLLPFINQLQTVLGTVVQTDELIKDREKYYEARKNLNKESTSRRGIDLDAYQELQD